METDLITKHKTFFTMNQGIPSPEIYHTFDQLLGLQLITGITGDILEIGVLQGATIAFLATSLAEKERAFLIDPYQNLNHIKDVIATFAQVNLEQMLCFPFDSKIMAKRHAHFLGNHYPSFRFIHIDGEHSYDAVYSDINLAYKYLGEGGLIVLDRYI
ncbi:class I SAM-dependent methyltransferase [Cyanobacterium aponinum]|uniref:class I SAM-dependent methyltransferase n=1 Tax=Cyanobacterium aponinum TaxID=379064 RepID=UPI000C12A4CF|nr:class I SAM-dependent methyltransferase [Cyanobacterium aponinum]PHV62800.1 hypothetical protein CSQ80_08780 [Cyanobacterium aponinum IPPAS B-1201]